MLNELGDYSAEIIFTTAYNHYLDRSAPAECVRLPHETDLHKRPGGKPSPGCRSILRSLPGNVSDVLKQSLNKNINQDSRIAVPTWEGLEFIHLRNVIRIESNSNYSRIFFYLLVHPSS